MPVADKCVFIYPKLLEHMLSSQKYSLVLEKTNYAENYTDTMTSWVRDYFFARAA